MSLLISTCSLINSSLNVITGFKQLNSKFALILQPHRGLRIADDDRRRIQSVHRRVECLIEPLNFCVLWTKDKDSCILPILQYSSDLVQAVSEFLDRAKFTSHDSDPFTRVLDPESSARVDYFLRELDFACSSVSLALSVTKSLDSTLPRSAQGVSSSALLKASARITEMLNRSGDLCAVSGSLMRRSASKWNEVSASAILKISHYNTLDPYEAPYLVRVSFGTTDSGLNFPIQTALSLNVSSLASLGLINSLPVDSLALTWTYFGAPDESNRRLIHRNPSGALDTTSLSMDSSDEDTIVVRGHAEVPRTLRARISSTHISGAESEAEYAFLYNFSSTSLSPLDVVYIARLCVLESLCRPSCGNDSTTLSSPKSVIHSALHLEASDETLTALLVDAKIFPAPVTPEIDLSLAEQ